MYDPWHHLAAEHPTWTVAWGELTGAGERGHTDFVTSTIWLDWRLPPRAERSSLAHELGHVERGPFPRHLREKEEALCEDLAARRLLPLVLLLDAVAWSNDIVELAWVLGVDVAMMRARVEGLDAWERDRLDVHLRGRELTFPK